MQMRSLHRLIVQHNLPHAEREGKGARETFVAAPEREAVRHRGEQLRIERPDRHLRVCDRVGAGRYLDLVVEPHLAPAVGRADPPQARPGEESVRIDVAGRPVNVAWLVERRRDEGNGRIGLRRKQERALLHRPGPGGIWSVFTQLHANGNARRRLCSSSAATTRRLGISDWATSAMISAPATGWSSTRPCKPP